MKIFITTLFALLGLASLMIGSAVTNAKFHDGQKTVLTILDTVAKPDALQTMHMVRYTTDQKTNPDTFHHTNFVVIN